MIAHANSKVRNCVRPNSSRAIFIVNKVEKVNGGTGKNHCAKAQGILNM